MHPYIAEVISAERAKDMRTRAALVRRAREARRSQRREDATSKAAAASLAALPVRWRALSLRREAHPVMFEPAAAGSAGGRPVR